MSRHPWLLYAYPWMPYPRRVIIYLREKGIPSSLVTIVPVSDPQLGSGVDPKYPPKPPGSLPILAIPQDDSGHNFSYVRQSLAIMNYIDELCDGGLEGFPLSIHSMRGANIVERAHVTEVLALADECNTLWNPVRSFGTAVGPMVIPAASKEMLRWVRRSLMAIETCWKDRTDISSLRRGGDGRVNMADIVLYQFLEFTDDCYGVDMTRGSGERVTDVYGREVLEAFPRLSEFYEAFKTRDSAVRDVLAGEVASPQVLEKMKTWFE
jgi:glutathione S-transferase